MRPGSRLARNVGLMSASEVVIKLFTLSFFMLLARRLGVEGMGRWTYAFTFVSLFMNFFNFGLAMLYTREAASRPEQAQSLLDRFLPLRLLLAGAGLALLIPVAMLGRKAASPLLVGVFGVALAGSLLSDLVRSVFRARQRMEYDAALNVAERGLASLMGVAALALGFHVLGTAAAWALGTLAAVGLAVFWTGKSGLRWQPRLDRAAAAAILKQAAPLFFLGVLATLYFRQDVLFLRWLRTEHELGLYGAAYRVIDMLVFLPGSMALAYLPAASSALAQSPDVFRALCRRSLAITFTLSVPLAVVLWFRADDVVRILFGPQFAGAAGAVRVLVGTLLFFFANPILGNTLIAGNLQKLPAISVGIGVVVNAGLNLFLIPRMGILGAAWATLLTEAMLFLVQGAFVVTRLVPMNLFAPMARPILAGAGLALVMWLLRGMPFFVALGLAVASYVGLGALLRLWSRSEFLALIPRRTGGGLP